MSEHTDTIEINKKSYAALLRERDEYRAKVAAYEATDYRLARHWADKLRGYWLVEPATDAEIAEWQRDMDVCIAALCRALVCDAAQFEDGAKLPVDNGGEKA